MHPASEQSDAVIRAYFREEYEDTREKVRDVSGSSLVFCMSWGLQLIEDTVQLCQEMHVCPDAYAVPMPGDVPMPLGAWRVGTERMDALLLDVFQLAPGRNTDHQNTYYCAHPRNRRHDDRVGEFYFRYKLRAFAHHLAT